jgi:hypothetical protein
MICQVCGIEAPTKYVSLHQNIGALVMRFTKSLEGEMCKNCIHKHFWRFTLTNLVLGWWGVISFIITPFLILNNIIRYVLCLGLEPVPPDAQPPKLTQEAAERLKPHVQALFEKLKAGENLPDVAGEIANRALVTPGQVVLYVRAVARAQAGK